jgi:hypothetical protein
LIDAGAPLETQHLGGWRLDDVHGEEEGTGSHLGSREFTALDSSQGPFDDVVCQIADLLSIFVLIVLVEAVEAHVSLKEDRGLCDL